MRTRALAKVFWEMGEKCEELALAGEMERADGLARAIKILNAGVEKEKSDRKKRKAKRRQHQGLVCFHSEID